MGLERFNAGFLLHVLNEQGEFDELTAPRLKDSMDRWWANCLRNSDERSWIGKIIRKVREGDIVFTRADYEKALLNRKQNGKFENDIGS
jgi:hypothetical protein